MIKKILSDCLKISADSLIRLDHAYVHPVRSALVPIRPAGPPRGHVLLAHKLEGCLQPDRVPTSHNNFTEAMAMAEGLRARGFAVDVISCERTRFVPRRRYDLFLCTRTNFEMLARWLNPDCIKVVHLETMHWLANNIASLARSRAVLEARGITPERHITIETNRAIELADYATLLGNAEVHATYAFAGKPVFELPNLGTTTYPWDAAKDFAACRRRFLWIGSGGLAHKGLGLVLEAFAQMPEMHLTVCGPLDQEPRFAEAYRRELASPNVTVRGWVDITGPDYAALLRETLGIVYPSCAEAQAGTVINSLHAGLIPVVSRETGLDVDPGVGVVLPEASVAAVRAAVRGLAARPPAELAAMARRAWETARATHTRDRYADVFGGVIARILDEHPNGTARGFVRLASQAPDAARPRLRSVG